MNPRVLALVLSYNKKALVLECLASLAGQHYQPCQVLVVDNASTDGSQSAIRHQYPQFDLLCNEENLGAAGGRNAGVDYARPRYQIDYILFLDDDAEVSPDSIGELVDALDKDPAAGLACGKTYIRFGSSVLMSTGVIERFHFGFCTDRGAGQQDTGRYDRQDYVDACGAFAFIIRSELFDRLDGFDTAYDPYGFEDFDLCLRARALGQRTLYVPTARLAHKGTQLGRPPKAVYERNKVAKFFILAERHMSRTQKLSATFFLPIRALAVFARFIRRGQARMIVAQLRGAWDYMIRLHLR